MALWHWAPGSSPSDPKIYAWLYCWLLLSTCLWHSEHVLMQCCSSPTFFCFKHPTSVGNAYNHLACFAASSAPSSPLSLSMFVRTWCKSWMLIWERWLSLLKCLCQFLHWHEVKQHWLERIRLTLSGNEGLSTFTVRATTGLREKLCLWPPAMVDNRNNRKGGTASLRSRMCVKRKAVFGAHFKRISLYFLYQKGNLIRIKMGLDTYLIRIQTRTPLSRYALMIILRWATSVKGLKALFESAAAQNCGGWFSHNCQFQPHHPNTRCECLFFGQCS